MQSLGSYDTDRVDGLYRRLALLPGNNVAQVHRYLDLGARLEVCKGPVDILAAEAVRALLAVNPGRPVLLAESGAVEPSHTGPFKLYAKDTHGMLLHDILFAPFFAGAAGPGHTWHWDAYVSRNNLWWHYGRFAEAVKDLDPPAEHFQAFQQETDRVRVYGLSGRKTILLWCRDKLNDWRAELLNGEAPQPVRQEVLTLDPVLSGKVAGASATVGFYDPWANHWRPGEILRSRITLPDFQRSLVVRIGTGH
jgi:hypothetical protein